VREIARRVAPTSKPAAYLHNIIAASANIITNKKQKGLRKEAFRISGGFNGR
jgi:hypothetical protein